MTRAPLAAGFLCYLIWGFVPLAFQASAATSPSDADASVIIV